MHTPSYSICPNPQSMTRHDALLLCESEGGFLAEPKSQDQASKIETRQKIMNFASTLFVRRSICWQGSLSLSLTSLASTPGGLASLTRVTRAGVHFISEDSDISHYG